MFDKISFDCLNLIFSFGTTREMGSVMCTSKKCRAIMRKCDYAWYEMYIRLYKLLNKDYDKHNSEYCLDCLRNPTIPDNRRFRRDTKLISDDIMTKIMEVCQTDQDKYMHIAVIDHTQPNWWHSQNYGYEMCRINRLQEKDYQRTIKNINQEYIPLMNEVCKKMAICVNPTHNKMPQFKRTENYRRMLRILFINHNKKVKFTKNDVKKLADLEKQIADLQRKKRIAELVADYK